MIKFKKIMQLADAQLGHPLIPTSAAGAADERAAGVAMQERAASLEDIRAKVSEAAHPFPAGNEKLDDAAASVPEEIFAEPKQVLTEYAPQATAVSDKEPIDNPLEGIDALSADDLLASVGLDEKALKDAGTIADASEADSLGQVIDDTLKQKVADGADSESAAAAEEQSGAAAGSAEGLDNSFMDEVDRLLAEFGQLNPGDIPEASACAAEEEASPISYDSAQAELEEKEGAPSHVVEAPDMSDALSGAEKEALASVDAMEEAAEESINTAAAAIDATEAAEGPRDTVGGEDLSDVTPKAGVSKTKKAPVRATPSKPVEKQEPEKEEEAPASGGQAVEADDNDSAETKNDVERTAHRPKNKAMDALGETLTSAEKEALNIEGGEREAREAARIADSAAREVDELLAGSADAGEETSGAPEAAPRASEEGDGMNQVELDFTGAAAVLADADERAFSVDTFDTNDLLSRILSDLDKLGPVEKPEGKAGAKAGDTSAGVSDILSEAAVEIVRPEPRPQGATQAKKKAAPEKAKERAKKDEEPVVQENEEFAAKGFEEPAAETFEEPSADEFEEPAAVESEEPGAEVLEEPAAREEEEAAEEAEKPAGGNLEGAFDETANDEEMVSADELVSEILKETLDPKAPSGSGNDTSGTAVIASAGRGEQRKKKDDPEDRGGVSGGADEERATDLLAAPAEPEKAGDAPKEAKNAEQAETTDESESEQEENIREELIARSKEVGQQVLDEVFGADKEKIRALVKEELSEKADSPPRDAQRSVLAQESAKQAGKDARQGEDAARESLSAADLFSFIKPIEPAIRGGIAWMAFQMYRPFGRWMTPRVEQILTVVSICLIGTGFLSLVTAVALRCAER